MHKQQFLYRIIESTFSLSYVCNMRLMYLDKKNHKSHSYNRAKKQEQDFRSIYLFS